MKKSDIHKIIKEEILDHTLEEGVLDFVFNIASNVAGAIIDKHRDFLLTNLKNDPEIRAMQKDVGLSRDKMVRAFTDRYKSSKNFKTKVDSLIKKVR